MGQATRHPTDAEMKQMGALIDSAMRDGAMGLGTGLIYLPSTFFSTEELIALTKYVTPYKGGYAAHIRSEGTRLLDAIRETIQIAAGAGTWAEIRHIKSRSLEQMQQAVALIDSARRAGIDITADQYPYIASGTGLQAMFNEEALRYVMRQPWVSVGQDAGAVSPDSTGKWRERGHPRGFGTFPRILGRYVRQDSVITLEFAIRKMTSLAAQRVGINDRGLLKPGMFADVTVFDPNTIIDNSTFENPSQIATGVSYVLVNGVPVVDGGQVTAALPGRALRGPGYRPH